MRRKKAIYRGRITNQKTKESSNCKVTLSLPEGAKAPQKLKFAIFSRPPGEVVYDKTNNTVGYTEQYASGWERTFGKREIN